MVVSGLILSLILLILDFLKFRGVLINRVVVLEKELLVEMTFIIKLTVGVRLSARLQLHSRALASVHWHAVVIQDAASPELVVCLVAGVLALVLVLIWVRLVENTLAFDLRPLLHPGPLDVSATRSVLEITAGVEVVTTIKFKRIGLLMPKNTAEPVAGLKVKLLVVLFRHRIKIAVRPVRHFAHRGLTAVVTEISLLSRLGLKLWVVSATVEGRSLLAVDVVM